MKIIDCYLATTIVKTIFMVIIALLALEIFVELSIESSDIGTGGYNLFRAFLYVLMLLPTNVYQFFPMAGLLGSLIGLGLLASHNELVIMRVSGLSMQDVIQRVAKGGLVIVIAMFLIGEVMAPSMGHYAIRYKTNALTNGQALYTVQGTWLRSNNDFINIGTIKDKKDLQNIVRYKFSENHKLELVSAAQDASFENDEWIFHNVKESKFTDSKIITNNYPTQSWNVKFSPHLLGLMNINTEQKNLLQLKSYIKYLHENGLQTVQYKFTFWQRILQPFVALLMILLGVPFVFGPLRTSAMGLRIMVGAIIGLIFYTVNQFLGPVSIIYHIPPFVAASFPSMSVILFGSGLLFFRR